MSDKEHDKERPLDADRLAQAEPGIKLKVSDATDEKLISSAISSLAEPAHAQPHKSEMQSLRDAWDKEDDAQLLTSLENVAEEGAPSEPEKLYAEIRKLPSLWPALVILLLTAQEPAATLFFSFFYWVFCSYRTSRVVKNVLGARNVVPDNVLGMALVPVFIMLFSVVVIGIFRAFGSLPYLFAEFFRIGIWALMISYVVYQWKWPISSSIAIAKFQRSHAKTSAMPGFLLHFGTGLLFNLVPLLFIANYYFPIVTHYYTFVEKPAIAILCSAAFIFAQYVGFFLLRRRIVAAALLDQDLKKFNERAKKVAPKVSDDDIIVRYRAFAEWERWFKHRLKEKSSKKFIFFVVMIAGVAFFFLNGGPEWCLTTLTQMPGVAATGIAGGATAAMNNINFLNIFQTFIISVFLAAGILYVSKPTHVGFSQKGIRFLWRHPVFEVNGTYVKWSAFKRIRLTLPKGKTSPSDQQLLFDAGSSTGADRDVLIKLSSVIQIDDKERMLKAIEIYAPQVERDASVLQALQAAADHSYTELWLQALAAPPKRERFKPLSDDATLADGKFQVLGQLGVGGQGTAYLAKDTHAETSVVLKEFILPVYVDVTVRRQALERFENEARILKHLDCDQIVKLIDFFVEDHRSYLVLEHIDGKSLKQIVEEEGAMSEERVLELSMQMCTILKYLHGLSPPVVHRDFTPDNLILRTDGKLKLVDFNVAQQTDSTATCTVVGKHSYLPPEQFRGTPVPQSDLYSLGATLHFLLTGQDPEPISISHPRRVNEDVSESMDILVARATAMTLEQRHQNVAELEQEISYFFGRVQGTKPANAEGEPEPAAGSDDTASETKNADDPI